MLSSYSEWATKFMESWKALDGEKTAELLSRDVKYYETPNGEPCASWDEVLGLWRVVPRNQKDITYSFDIICYSQEVCIINWKMNRVFINGSKESKQSIDGIFQISLDKEGKCNFFKQWRHTETED